MPGGLPGNSVTVESVTAPDAKRPARNLAFGFCAGRSGLLIGNETPKLLTPEGVIKVSSYPLSDERVIIASGFEEWSIKMIRPVAVLSSTILTPGTFSCVEIEFGALDLKGVPSYVSHLDTKLLMERFGAEYTPGLFSGLRVGEQYVAVPLANPTRSPGWTVDVAVTCLSELNAKLVTRLA